MTWSAGRDIGRAVLEETSQLRRIVQVFDPDLLHFIRPRPGWREGSLREAADPGCFSRNGRPVNVHA